MPTFGFSFEFIRGNRSPINTLYVEGESYATYTISIPANTADHAIAASFSLADVMGIYLLSTRDLLLKTNSDVTPNDTIALIAGHPFVWIADWYLVCPFSASVASLYATNATSQAATLDMRIVKGDPSGSLPDVYNSPVLWWPTEYRWQEF